MWDGRVCVCVKMSKVEARVERSQEKLKLNKARQEKYLTVDWDNF